MRRDVTTTCGYCGVGCRLEAHATDGRVMSITPGARRARQQGPHVPEGPLRAPVLAQPRALEHAADPRRRRRPAARDVGRGDRADRRRADAHPRRPRRRRDRRPRVLARDQRGLLRHAAPDARGDRHAQHRQLLARLPLPHVVGDAQVARPVRRDRLVRRHRARGRGDHHRRQPDRGPSGRRRAHQAGRAARDEARHDRPAPDRARRLRRAAPQPAPGLERRRDARPRPRRRA